MPSQQPDMEDVNQSTYGRLFTEHIGQCVNAQGYLKNTEIHKFRNSLLIGIKKQRSWVHVLDNYL